ncbi:hypothetical protein BZG36_01572 [Bifiguratus adelaidae]|uniref:Sensor domain-containing protein n=1 Tax=Bifiguratus adelaidae TaxID=1938954 RepID=A0A261Y3Z8_9FUNG|nr:hypothetical protein BZG36_01572 [Bifiguratus adelaidae]
MKIPQDTKTPVPSNSPPSSHIEAPPAYAEASGSLYPQSQDTAIHINEVVIPYPHHPPHAPVLYTQGSNDDVPLQVGKGRNLGRPYLCWIYDSFGWRAAGYFIILNPLIGMFLDLWCFASFITAFGLFAFPPLGLPIFLLFVYSWRASAHARVWLYHVSLGNPYHPDDPRYREYAFGTRYLPSITRVHDDPLDDDGDRHWFPRFMNHIWRISTDVWTLKVVACGIANFFWSVLALMCATLFFSFGVSFMICLLPLVPFLCRVLALVQGKLIRALIGGVKYDAKL